MPATLEEVSKIAETLESEGMKPTIDRVRERLGGGSKSDIGPLLQDWRKLDRDKKIGDIKIERPEALEKFLSNALDQVWNIVKTESDTAIATIKSEELKEREALENDLKTINEHCKRLENSNDDLSLKNKDSEKVIIEKDKLITALQTQIQMLKEQSEQDDKKYFSLLEKFQNQKPETKEQEKKSG